MKKGILGLVKKVGYTVVKEQPNEKKYPDIEKEFWPLFEACKPYTMSSVERLYSLYKSLDYIIQNNIPGDFVECGVWRGGVPMFIAKVLMKHKLTFRKIYLYDTYEGMPPPTTNDVDYKGRNADVLMDLHDGDKKAVDSVWCYSPYDEVASNMRSTGYPTENIVMVKGKVEDTIPANAPKNICLLRLDTDWYESTFHELTHLYPLLSSKGILIIDDYGHWEGARRAVDDYFSKQTYKPLLHRIDYTGRIALKD